jgi:hypothetical protein
MSPNSHMNRSSDEFINLEQICFDDADQYKNRNKNRLYIQILVWVIWMKEDVGFLFFFYAMFLLIFCIIFPEFWSQFQKIEFKIRLE